MRAFPPMWQLQLHAQKLKKQGGISPAPARLPPHSGTIHETTSNGTKAK